MHHQHGRFHAAHRRDWDGFTDAVESAWNQINPFQKGADQTVYMTVYTTKTPDNWDGTADAWTTLPPAPTTTSAAHAAVVTTPSTTPKQTTTPKATSTAPATTANALVLESSSIPKSIVPSSQSSVGTSLALATDTPTPSTALAAESSPALASSTASAQSDSSGGTSAAAKAGIAIGVLAGLFVVGALVWLAFSRRRKQMEKQRLEDDEKLNGPFSDRNEIPKTPASAPRLSLRPVTQFLPNLNGQSHPDRRTSRGAMIAMVPSPGASRPAGSSPWERPVTSGSENSANPFGNDAERSLSPVHESQHVAMNGQPGTSVGVAETTNSPPQASALAGAAAGASLTRKTSIRKDAPKPLDLTVPGPLPAVPASPAGTEFSVSSVSPGQAPGPSASAAAIAAAGGPAASTVHRVQLDFKPTMDDEMELKAGQLVRLLHEYDDGWALCIRLDRSQQGVVPRTCLSTRPVKPRPPQGGPRGPPVNPQRGPNYPGRPMTPQGGPPYPRPASPAGSMGPRPHSPAGMRSQSPAGRSMGPYGGRPQSPAGGRPMSPGPRPQSPGPRAQHHGRPQSPGDMNRRMSPPGPSQMSQEYRPPTGSVSRKPVPGQAY